ncbi:MAG: DUF2851 family protein [Mariniphaga sp.]|nr:DUF2851 family protein [Mariniphaga sp.]MDD4225104.1 DUF2851 family protein [Mariniphaga sp.]MDD4424440.1 DUF2851 family protein [Mariniphaga sp.]
MYASKPIPEEFIYYIWENQLFDGLNLKSMTNEPVEVISTGCRNTDSGPDFFNAKVNISGTLWAGNIEVHKKASDWDKHNHTADKAYENVILHVVEHADKQIFRANGTAIPTIELKWPDYLSQNYRKLMISKAWIACQEQFFRLDPVILRLAFNRLMIDRLEEKTKDIDRILKQNCCNWSETFYQMLTRMFGFKVNASPFGLLAKIVPMHLLAKHKNSLFQMETLLYGASGLLGEELLGDDYFMLMQKEFRFLQKKYKLKTIEPHLWKFMRLRPVNFPTIRISQLATLIYRSEGLFSKMMEARNIQMLQDLFRVKASAYWDSHFRFNRKTKSVFPRELGESSANMLIINVVVPFLFVYGEKQNLDDLKDRALDFLEKIPPEDNTVIRKWKQLGVDARNAFESQALLQLKSRFCVAKKCLHCPIGNSLVRAG